MDLVLAGLTWEVCLMYLDDDAVMADTFERHLERLKFVLDRLQRADLKLDPAKCKLFKLKGNFQDTSQVGEESNPTMRR